MPSKTIHRLIAGFVAAIAVCAAFAFWALADNHSLNAFAAEDGLLEYATALLFGISGIGFFIAARKSGFLKGKPSGPRYFVIVSWGLLMLVFMGEEISWGQRIFQFRTPDTLRESNLQREFNLHNASMLNDSMGGTYRMLSLMMLLTGVVIPAAARTRPGKRLVQWWAFPVLPAPHVFWFMGSLAYGYTFHRYTYQMNDAAEIRELLLGIGMVLFSWHGVWRPDDLFLVESPDTGPAKLRMQGVT